VTVPREGVRVPSAIVCGLWTVCRVPGAEGAGGVVGQGGLDADHPAVGVHAAGGHRAAGEEAAAAAGVSRTSSRVSSSNISRATVPWPATTRASS